MSRETVIWLEIHLKLNSRTGLFCGCLNVQEFEDLSPNTNICPICTAQPGALPVLQPEPLEKAILLGLALQCTIREVSHFDRKSYFYPDLPPGYQITQQRQPTCIDGTVNFWADKEFTEWKSVRIRDAHIETDTGKTNQVAGGIAVDRNRAGTPLVEIVTQPDFRTSDEVVAFLKELQKIARLHDISDAELESGQLRCDVNISLRPAGHDSYGTRVEMKNMSSWSAIAEAIHHEQIRQEQILDMWGVIDQETRGRDDANKLSYVMRSKEDATDYRFMAEPDLPPIVLQGSDLDKIRKLLHELPVDTIERYKNTYGFHKEFINGLLVNTQMQRYFESLVADGHDAKTVATWLVGPIARRANDQQKTVDELPFSRDVFVAFLDLLAGGKLTSQTWKSVITEMLQTWITPADAMEKLGIRAIWPEQISTWLDEIFTEKPDLLADLQAGNMKPLGFITGQVMKMSGGSADPQMIKIQLEKKIGF
jgi:aspartyl-tRNA(Asn)/glutamyl-tRNA(Gln) amidotransferase subunit B